MKPRSDAVLLNLPPDQQARISEWLSEGVEEDEGRNTSYKAVCAAIFADLGVKTSPAALANFYRQVVAPRRLRTAAAAAEHFVTEAEARGVSFSSAAKLAVKQKLFELSASDTVDPQELLAFASVVADFDRGELKRRDQELKAQDLAQKERRIMALEAQARQAKEQIAKLRDPKTELSNEDRAAILRKADELLLGTR